MRHEVGVGDQDFWCILMRFENNYWFPGLHEKRFVLLQVLERLQDRLERFPGAGGFPTPTIHDKLFGLLRDFRVEVVLDHAIGGFTEPVLAGEICASGRADSSRSRHDVVSLSNKKSLLVIIRRQGFVFYR